MNAQRRVTAPPDTKAEVVTDSLRADSPGTPGSTAADPGHTRVVPVSPHKEFRWIPPQGSRAFAQAFSPSRLILPSIPGVG
ncbi:MAG: hypothetical protein ABSC65_22500 [Acidobacteriaceae bacterium]|jgi:hypothetical protein